MFDYKMQLIKELEVELSQVLNADSFESTIDVITRALNGYDVTKSNTVRDGLI